MKLRVFLVVTSCVVSLVTGFLLSREGSSTEGTKARAKPLIGLSMDTFKEERWQGDRDSFVARAKELGAEVLVQSANSDDTRQISDIQALISRARGCARDRAAQWRRHGESRWHGARRRYSRARLRSVDHRVRASICI